jgi:hypothetical protein
MKQMRALLYEGDIKRLRVSCRCGNTWIEEVPGEIYDANFIAPLFECEACHQEYYLLHKHVRRVDVDPDDPPMREYIYNGEPKRSGQFDA